MSGGPEVTSPNADPVGVTLVVPAKNVRAPRLIGAPSTLGIALLGLIILTAWVPVAIVKCWGDHVSGSPRLFLVLVVSASVTAWATFAGWGALARRWAVGLRRIGLGSALLPDWRWDGLVGHRVPLLAAGPVSARTLSRGLVCTAGFGSPRLDGPLTSKGAEEPAIRFPLSPRPPRSDP